MLVRVLADLVVLFHVAFVVFVVAGGLLVARRPWVAYLHVPAALWGIAIELCGWICPLTPLENWLRARGGGVTYPGGFVEHWVLPVLYPAALTRETQLVLAALVLLVNAVVYGAVLRRCRLARPQGRR